MKTQDPSTAAQDPHHDGITFVYAIGNRCWGH